jgi:hypothetical protein
LQKPKDQLDEQQAGKNAAQAQAREISEKITCATDLVAGLGESPLVTKEGVGRSRFLIVTKS